MKFHEISLQEISSPDFRTSIIGVATSCSGVALDGEHARLKPVNLSVRGLEQGSLLTS